MPSAKLYFNFNIKYHVIMRKYLILLIFAFVFSTTFSNAQSNGLEDVKNDSIINNNLSIQNIDNVIYRLFPTENMWTFIKLNTRNGKMWQVQFDIKGDNRFETYLNLFSLVTQTKEENGRFTLYPTQNMYNFILLDQIDGKIWQVQWSTEPENRVIIPIN